MLKRQIPIDRHHAWKTKPSVDDSTDEHHAINQSKEGNINGHHNATDAIDGPNNGGNSDILNKRLNKVKNQLPNLSIKPNEEDPDLEGFDPFQVFEVNHEQCTILHVTVFRGYNITKGSWTADLLDTPDPYVCLSIAQSPTTRQSTQAIDNDINPVWNETFQFILDHRLKTNTLTVTLMDSNFTIDEQLGEIEVPLHCTMHRRVNKHIKFEGTTSAIEIQYWTEHDNKPELRYSLTLCDEEKEFLENRVKKVFMSMQDILGKDAPDCVTGVPTIGVLGSGGGFRAMTGFCGVMAALVDSKILDMATYVAGLSGSAWYISTLYSHQDWPKKTPGDLKDELRNNIDSSLFKLLTPQSMYRYISRIMEKKRHGQPVSFTDFFGHLVGETLLKGRLDSKLSDQRMKLKNGEVPLPLYTCLHVKKQVSAMIFHEWMEFSPYEIGMPKYGTFLRPEQFGNKFFMGRLVKKHDEPPLHFLQGIWGSAFCIQFNRLLQKEKNCDAAEMCRKDLEKELGVDMKSEDHIDDSADSDEDETDSPNKPTSNKPTFWEGMLEKVFDSTTYLSTREGRAAMVHNFMRGLSLANVYPFSPFAIRPASVFKDIFELHPTDNKRMYVVDGGLTFNSPYPMLLRPQRATDILLSFDFSARETDAAQPFKELLLAEKWARLNNVPFPPIDVSVFDREGMKECYIFRHPHDQTCPIIIHFVLVNLTFRREKAPGVPRVTKEEKEFANFDIFDDPEHPYSTFNFTYTHKAFNHLTQLMEYNTLHYKDLIIQIIKECVVRKSVSCRMPIQLEDVKTLGLKNRQSTKRLKSYLKSVKNRSGVRRSGRSTLATSISEIVEKTSSMNASVAEQVDKSDSQTDEMADKSDAVTKSVDKPDTVASSVETRAKNSGAMTKSVDEPDTVASSVETRAKKSGAVTKSVTGGEEKPDTMTPWEDESLPETYL